MLHNQTIVSLVGPYESWATVSKVHKVAIVKEIVKHGNTSAVWG